MVWGASQPPGAAAPPRRGALPYLRAGVVGWRASRLWTLVAYGLTVLGFALFLIGCEVGLGDPLVLARSPGNLRSIEDAAWHLGTGLALALPARRWSAAAMASLMTLGLDGDHIFGDLLPTVIGRTDHCLVFLVAAPFVLYALQGRTAALLGAGAVLAHLSLDGGAFPLFAPVSVATYAFPLAVTAVGAVAAALLFSLAFRPRRVVLSTRSLLAIAVVSAVCVAAYVVLVASVTFLSV